MIMTLAWLIGGLSVADHFAFDGSVRSAIARETMHTVRSVQNQTQSWVDQIVR